MGKGSERLVQTHNQQSFEDLVLKYKNTLYKISATFEADLDKRQELQQEMLLAIWQALPNFRGEACLHTFVYRVAYNQALNHVGKSARRVKAAELEDSHKSIPSNQGPAEKVSSKQQLERLYFAIRQLPILSRQVVSLSLDGMSYQHISDITGLSVSNVGVRLNRAKSDLQQYLEVGNE